MGGEGSMQHMINVLRNNKSLLRKKSMFKRERSFLNTRKEYYKAAQGKIELKNITKEELLSLRNKVIKQRKVDTIKAWGIVFLMLTPFIVLGIYTSKKLNKQRIQQIEIVKENYLIQNLNEYSYLIEEGDKWIEKRNWNNAIYRYKQAVELFPNEFEANYRLALAYSYRCKYENKDCKKGNTLTNLLLKYSPKSKNLLELKRVFE